VSLPMCKTIKTRYIIINDFLINIFYINKLLERYFDFEVLQRKCGKGCQCPRSLQVQSKLHWSYVHYICSWKWCQSKLSFMKNGPSLSLLLNHCLTNRFLNQKIYKNNIALNYLNSREIKYDLCEFNLYDYVRSYYPYSYLS